MPADDPGEEQDQPQNPKSLMTEEWRKVVGWPAYEVSNMGNVRRVGGQRLPQGMRLRKLKLSKSGYMEVALWSGGSGKTSHYLVHRLVAAAFIGPAGGRDVNHIDADRKNNRVENLEYVTKRQNVYHCMALGRHARGTRIHGAVLNEVVVKQVREKLALGIPQTHIADDLGVSKCLVHLIAKGKTWRWVE